MVMQFSFIHFLAFSIHVLNENYHSCITENESFSLTVMQMYISKYFIHAIRSARSQNLHGKRQYYKNECIYSVLCSLALHFIHWVWKFVGNSLMKICMRFVVEVHLNDFVNIVVNFSVISYSLHFDNWSYFSVVEITFPINSKYTLVNHIVRICSESNFEWQHTVCFRTI